MKRDKFYEDMKKEEEQVAQKKIMREEADQIVKLNREISNRRVSMFAQRRISQVHQGKPAANQNLKNLEELRYLSSNDFNNFLDFEVDKEEEKKKSEQIAQQFQQQQTGKAEDMLKYMSDDSFEDSDVEEKKKGGKQRQSKKLKKQQRDRRLSYQSNLGMIREDDESERSSQPLPNQTKISGAAEVKSPDSKKEESVKFVSENMSPTGKTKKVEEAKQSNA